MCKTYLKDIGIDYETRQAYVDHAKETVMDRIYDKSDSFDDMADAARRLLAYLNRLEEETQSQKVVSIR